MMEQFGNLARRKAQIEADPLVQETLLRRRSVAPEVQAIPQEGDIIREATANTVKDEISGEERQHNLSMRRQELDLQKKTSDRNFSLEKSAVETAGSQNKWATGLGLIGLGVKHLQVKDYNRQVEQSISLLDKQLEFAEKSNDRGRKIALWYLRQWYKNMPEGSLAGLVDGPVLDTDNEIYGDSGGVNIAKPRR